MCCNTLWGKYGENVANHIETKDLFTSKELEALLDEDIDMKVYDAWDESHATVKFQRKETSLDTGSRINVMIAAFTTSYARLRLYEALELLGNDVVYCDTDSVFFTKSNQEKVICDTGLGSFKNELKNNEYITEMIAIAPKSYAYKTNLGKIDTKLKGVSLSIKNKKIINFKSLYQLLNNEKTELITKDRVFRIDNENSTISTKDMEKKIRFDYTKGRIIGKRVYPFGYNDKIKN